ncbi:MAG: hypothetical protein HYY50_02220 [Candidatus Kerfeldbacteria bacterium]|nr:hypothetical protein [Candidatus Kerfeldbacteria bacterium]
MLLRFVDQAERSLASIRQLLSGNGATGSSPLWRHKAANLSSVADQEGARIIEGVFDGQNMVGPDGKQYSVPANYASKSKLVEGDVLKLTITRDGSFIYKQIGPVERRRLVGELTRDSQTGEYKVTTDGTAYKVLLASVTYFKGEPGDEVVILVPQEGDSRWGAVENIIKKIVPSTEASQP